MADKTQYEKLRDLLYNTDHRPVYDQLQSERQQLDSILNSRDFSSHQDMVNAVTALARSVNEKVPFGFDERSFDFNPQPEPQQNSQPTSQSSQESTSASPRDQKLSNPPGRMRDTVTDKLHSVQEQQLLEEFDQAVGKNDQAKIRELLETRLEAPDLLEDQWKRANQYVSQITDNNIDKQQALRLLEEQKNKQLERIRSTKKSEEERLEEANQRKALSDALQAKNVSPKAKREAFQRFAGYKIAQTQPYSIFEIFESQQSGRALLSAITAMLQAEQQARMQAFRAQQQAYASQAAAQQQAQNTPRGNGLLNIARGNKKNGKLNRLLNSKLVGKAVNAAGPEATAVLWIVKHKKLVMIAIGVGIMVFIAIIVTVVVILISLVQRFYSSNTQSTQATLGATCTPSSTCVDDLQKLGISVTGDVALGGDPFGKPKLFYETLSYISQAPSKYFQLLHTDQKPLLVVFQGGGCAGHASTDGTVKLYGFGACGTSVAKFMMIHELGHEIAFRNPDIYQKFYNQLPLPVLIFYKLPTFNCELDYGPGGPFPGECFADTLGEYPLYKVYRNTVSGQPFYFEPAFTTFPKLFPPFYNFAKDNIYNGLEF